MAGGAAGACGAVTATRGAVSLPGAVLLAGIGALVGWLGSERHDVHRARQRRSRIEQQLPVVADLLAFAVAAGESPLAALERVAATSTGELSDEIGSTVADVRSGLPLDSALLRLGGRIGSATVQRFVDGLVIAMERGTPIADVLRAQAADCRADERRRLMELAGRKDVLMLVPVVFLILPTVVLVALFPGIQSLRLVVA
jgi:tight adherence protein C